MTRQTSIQAYRTIEANGLLSKRRFQVYSALFHGGPLTAAELAHKIPGYKSESVGFNIHARLCELRARECVIELGEKKCSLTGNNVILWDVTEKLPTESKQKKLSLKQKIKILKQALEWYAKGYQLDVDEGERAREALKAIEE